MTVPIQQVNANADTWSVFISKFNTAANAISSLVVSVDGVANGNAEITGTYIADSFSGETYTGNVATFTTGNIATITTDDITAAVADIDSLTANTVVATTLSVSGSLTLSAINATTGNIVTLTSNVATITTGNVRTLSSNNATINVATITTGNVVTLTSNVATITTAAITTMNAATSFTNTLSIAVDRLLVTGGNTTHKYMTTNGSGNLSFTEIDVLNSSGFLDYSANVQNQIDGKVAKAGDTMTGALVLPAANTTATSARVPHGAAPTSPTNGDLWSTVSGFFARINGATRRFLTDGDIGSTVQGYDASTAKLNVEDQTLTGGARVTSKSLGTITSGTLTPDPGDRPLQHCTNGGAFSLLPGSNMGSYILDITNNASAGAITISSWTKVIGSFTTTNGAKFRCSCSIGNLGSLLIIEEL